MIHFLGIFLLGVVPTLGLNNGLALTPPMGFMTWQRFRCITDCKKYPDECISEDLILRQAIIMDNEEYKSRGYQYIIIDDCWASKERDENGRLQADTERFPSGIKSLANAVHSLGLKFGIYADYGTYTCGGYPGSIDYLKIDAETFAEWGVDYVKMDGCYAELDIMEDGYSEFGLYLNETGRPIVYSCSWPAYFEFAGHPVNFTKLADTCNLWRNWADIQDSWASTTSIMKWFGDNQDRFSEYSGPGHWNDPDMLLIGNFGLSLDQSRAQMAIWAIMAAPLLISVDLANIKPEFKEILVNQDIIDINQDRLGIMGKRVQRVDDIELWVKPILPIIEGDYSYAVAFISYRTDGHPFISSFSMDEIGLTADRYRIDNIYDQGNVNVDGRSIWARVNPSGTVFFKFTPEPL